jgi:hypothetical protein
MHAFINTSTLLDGLNCIVVLKAYWVNTTPSPGLIAAEISSCFQLVNVYKSTHLGSYIRAIDF